MAKPETPDGGPEVADRSYLAYLRPTPPPFVQLASGHFPAATQTQPHRHPCLALHGCIQGRLTLRTNEGELPVDAGVFFLLGPGVAHSWRNDGRHTAATLGLLVDPARPGRWPAAAGVGCCCQALAERVRGCHRFTTAGDRELRQSFWLVADHLTAERPREPLVLAGALLTLVGQIRERLAGPAPAADAALDAAQRIRRLLVVRVGEGLSIGQIAREAGLSPTRAKAAFRAAFGCGIMAYFHRLKMWQAQRLLHDPALTVEQVSRRLGFASPSYFSRASFRFTGATPRDYRHGGTAGR
jgi:AraC-like DNA-binding protein/quercetin dioxygenase-like cupin family protein